MLRHAVINPEGKVVNVIIWDGVSLWNPPKGHIAVQDNLVNHEDTYDFDKKIIIRKDRTVNNNG